MLCFPVTIQAKEANAEANRIRKENPALFEKLKDVIENEQLDLSSEEKALRQAPVADGTRAQLIYDRAAQIRAEQGDKAANQYLSDLKKKKVISTQVLKQLKAIAAEDNDTI